MIDAIKFGHYETIIWDDSKVCIVLERSFEFTQNGCAVKLPERFLQSIKIQNINTVHNSLFGIYL